MFAEVSFIISQLVLKKNTHNLFPRFPASSPPLCLLPITDKVYVLILFARWEKILFSSDWQLEWQPFQQRQRNAMRTRLFFVAEAMIAKQRFNINLCFYLFVCSCSSQSMTALFLTWDACNLNHFYLLPTASSFFIHFHVLLTILLCFSASVNPLHSHPPPPSPMSWPTSWRSATSSSPACSPWRWSWSWLLLASLSTWGTPTISSTALLSSSGLRVYWIVRWRWTSLSLQPLTRVVCPWNVLSFPPNM